MDVVNQTNAKKVVLWGTGDRGKPRVRLLERALQRSHFEVIDCTKTVWDKVEDKSQLSAVAVLIRTTKWLLSYPRLVWRYLRSPAHSFVFVTYPGLLDVLVIAPFAKLRGAQIVWDVFLSWYDAVVCDRRLVSRWNPIALTLYTLEWLAIRAADIVFLDTAEHARYIEQLFGRPKNSIGRVFVSAENLFTDTETQTVNQGSPRRVLFYGQFIPLHGIEVIVQAAKILERRGQKVEWTIVGRGQLSKLIDAYISKLHVKSIKRIAWVPYDTLKSELARADVCLGIFGTTGKAARVIPNKVFQILAAHKPLVTRDSPAIRELLQPDEHHLLINAGDPEALATAVLEVKIGRTAGRFVDGYELSIQGVSKQIQNILDHTKYAT